MTRIVGPLERDLRSRLRSAYRIAVVGVGDELNPFDRLGVMAAREVGELRLPQVHVFEAGTLPESFTGPVRRANPDAVLFLDAADMGLRPGAAMVIGAKSIAGSRLSTHALPLTVVMEFLRKTAKARIILIGLQPDPNASADALTPREEAGVTHLLTALQRVLAARTPPRGGPASRPRTRRGTRGPGSRRSRRR